jgi:hypothetical protein
MDTRPQKASVAPETATITSLTATSAGLAVTATASYEPGIGRVAFVLVDLTGDPPANAVDRKDVDYAKPPRQVAEARDSSVALTAELPYRVFLNRRQPRRLRPPRLHLRNRKELETMRPRAILVLTSALALATCAPVAAERLPVSSRDDETSALANRITAVADVVATMGGRVGRIEASLPPSPVTPPSPIYPALVSVQDAASALLATSGAIACATGGATDVSGGDTIADDDTRAEDLTGDGLVEQLGAVATALGQADARLTRIAALVSAAPSPSAIDSADAVWGEAAAVFNRTADLLANTDHTPPRSGERERGRGRGRGRGQYRRIDLHRARRR